MAPLAISRVRLRRVRIPLGVVYLSSMYLMPATHRTVIELETDDGSVGLGETLGTEDVFRLTAELARRWLGKDPRDRRGLDRAFARSLFDNRNGRNGWSAFAGLELAAWDLTTRRLGLSLSTAWGGPLRRRIPIVSPLPSLVLDQPLPLDRSELARRFADRGEAEAVAAFARAWFDRCGIAHFKYKSAGLDPDWDLHQMVRLRAMLGSTAGLRFDPNGAYPVAQAVALCRALEPLALEFYEDPTDDLEGLAAVRARVRGKVATNMFVVQTDQLAAAVRQGGVDVVLADIYMWGGVDRLRSMAAVASAFGLEVGIHSLFETGIGTALNLHLAATMPEITRATDSGLHLMARDVTVGASFAISDGAMAVPDGPGLGVGLDQDAMADLTIEERVVDGT